MLRAQPKLVEFGIIYTVTCDINKKKYVGQTIQILENRWYNHCYQVKLGSTLPLYNAIRKYGKENFTIEQIGQAENIDQLNILEIVAIRQLNTFVPNGYNLDEGGKNKGKRHLDTIAKLSSARIGVPPPNKGKPMSEEQKIKIGNSNRGKKHSPEQNAKNSATKMGNQNMLGKTHSSESKELMRLSQIGRSPNSGSFKPGSVPWNKGKIGVYSEDTLLAMRKPKGKIKQV